MTHVSTEQSSYTLNGCAKKTGFCHFLETEWLYFKIRPSLTRNTPFPGAFADSQLYYNFGLSSSLHFPNDCLHGWGALLGECWVQTTTTEKIESWKQSGEQSWLLKTITTSRHNILRFLCMFERTITWMLKWCVLALSASNDFKESQKGEDCFWFTFLVNVLHCKYGGGMGLLVYQQKYSCFIYLYKMWF